MKIPTLLSRALLSAALAVALCAQANPILIGNGYAAGSEEFSVTAPTTTANAGAFTGTWNGQPIIFFCFELTQYFQFGVPYSDYVASNPSNAQFALLSRLFTEAFDHVLDNTDNSAAFQLAVWEILYDPSPTSLSTGTFHVTNDFGNPQTVALATALLNNLPPVGTYSITWLHSCCSSRASASPPWVLPYAAARAVNVSAAPQPTSQEDGSKGALAFLDRHT